jgi:hypothetical protein
MGADITRLLPLIERTGVATAADRLGMTDAATTAVLLQPSDLLERVLDASGASVIVGGP